MSVAVAAMPDPAAAIRRRLGRRRRVANRVVLALCLVATAVAVALLASILVTLLQRGLTALSLHVFLHPTAPPGSHGGLLNPIVGSLIQTLLGMAAAVPLGLAVGIFLSEFGRGSRLAATVRFVSDVLLSAPSILVGLFVYVLLVAPFGGFSGWAGSAALAVIAVPIVVRTTEDMLRLVPVSLREASIALGAPMWRTTLQVSMRAARDGIGTGILLALARLSGETAPLLFTSLGNLNWSVRLGQPMASLPVTIYQYAGSAYSDWVDLAWTAALLITGGVLGINIVARALLRPRS
jgi:phosphate transport system permease protein